MRFDCDFVKVKICHSCQVNKSREFLLYMASLKFIYNLLLFVWLSTCQTCQKWFLGERITNAWFHFLQQEFNCNTPVDRVLLLTYLSTKEFRAQSLHERNTTLNCQPDWTWCPNTACGRLVKMVGTCKSDIGNDDAPMAINCECGLLWCSACKGEGHWPATCEQALAYWKLIKKNGKSYCLQIAIN